MIFSGQSIDPQDLPDDLRWAVAEASIQHQQEKLAAGRAYTEGQQQLTTEYLEALHGIIGEKRLEEYKRRHTKRMATMHELRQKAASSPEEGEKLERMRRQAVEESTRVIKASGADLDAVRRLQAEHVEKVAKLWAGTLGKGEELSGKPAKKNTTYRASDLLSGTYEMSMPHPVRNQATDEGGTVYRPSIDLEAERSGWAYTRCDSTLKIVRADNRDYSRALGCAGFYLLYLTKADGLIDIRVELQSVNSLFSGWCSPECGFSSLYLIQLGRVWVRVHYPASSTDYYLTPNLIDYQAVYPKVIQPWSFTIYPGTTKSCFGRIPRAFKKQSVLVLEVGVLTDQLVSSDDVTVDSRLRQEWLIKEIGVSQVE